MKHQSNSNKRSSQDGQQNRKKSNTEDNKAKNIKKLKHLLHLDLPEGFKRQTRNNNYVDPLNEKQNILINNFSFGKHSNSKDNKVMNVKDFDGLEVKSHRSFKSEKIKNPSIFQALYDDENILSSLNSSRKSNQKQDSGSVKTEGKKSQSPINTSQEYSQKELQPTGQKRGKYVIKTDDSDGEEGQAFLNHSLNTEDGKLLDELSNFADEDEKGNVKHIKKGVEFKNIISPINTIREKIQKQGRGAVKKKEAAAIKIQRFSRSQARKQMIGRNNKLQRFRRYQGIKEMIDKNNKLYKGIRDECKDYFRKNEKEALRLTKEFANTNPGNTGEELYQAFEEKINQYTQKNKEKNIIQAIRKERKSKKHSSSKYEKDYRDRFKADDNDIIDRGIRMIAAGRLTKELADCGKIHPAHKIPISDHAFQKYLAKHFNRFLIQMQKNPDDIKTNGELHTFVYYRGHFLKNLLNVVRKTSQDKDLSNKMDIIHKIGKQYKIEQDIRNIENLLETQTSDSESKSESSAIDMDSQSSQNGFQETDSESNESNLSRGRGSRQNDSIHYEEIDSQETDRESFKGFKKGRFNASENEYEDVDEKIDVHTNQFQHSTYPKMFSNKLNNTRIQPSYIHDSNIGEKSQSRIQPPKASGNSSRVMNPQNNALLGSKRGFEGINRIFKIRSPYDNTGVSSQEIQKSNERTKKLLSTLKTSGKKKDILSK